jgi:hypothetical protein
LLIGPVPCSPRFSVGTAASAGGENFSSLDLILKRMGAYIPAALQGEESA